MRPPYRPRYASCPSACLSVCDLSVPYGLVTRKQRNMEKKNKIGAGVLQGTRKWSTNFQLKRSKFKVIHKKSGVMFTYVGRSSAGAFGADCNLYAYCAIVRPNLLSAPEQETLGNWSARHSAPTWLCFLIALSNRVVLYRISTAYVDWCIFHGHVTRTAYLYVWSGIQVDKLTPRVHSGVTKRIQCRLHYRPLNKCVKPLSGVWKFF